MYLDSHLVKKEIDDAGGASFYVEFVKRTNGELRKMICRRGVSQFVKGTSQVDTRQVDTKNECLTVYEFSTGSYKRIPLDAVLALHINGKRL